jgi:hypothetical protein
VCHSHTSRQSALEVVEECRGRKEGRQAQGYDFKNLNDLLKVPGLNAKKIQEQAGSIVF